MTESRSAADTVPPTGTPERARDRNARLYQVLAWVGIVAGILFIVAVVFCSGFFAARAAGGYGWHRGYPSSQMRPDGPMGGCPMMQRPGGGMGPGGMGPGSMAPGGMRGGGMGPGGGAGTTNPSSPVPPPGQR